MHCRWCLRVMMIQFVRMLFMNCMEVRIRTKVNGSVKRLKKNSNQWVFTPSLVSANAWDTFILTYFYTDVNACSNTDQIHLSITPIPDSNITISNDTLYAVQGMEEYRWYRNDTLIDGEKQGFF